MKKRLFSGLLAVMMMVSLMSTTAFAAGPETTDTGRTAVQATSEFDFSAEDSIDAYDEYSKKELETSDGDIITYVDAAKMNTINNTNPSQYTPSFYRYGAYLRNSEEVQRYAFYNLDWDRNYTTMCNNTLTIYADPEVKFQVTNYSGQPVINTSGVQNQSLVQYYNKSTDYGHSVYYIELVPAESSVGQYMVTFWTDSVDSQPHYSFWYGAPLTRTATELIGNFALSVSAPNRASTAFPLTISSSIPKRAWVNTVTIKKLSTTGESNVSRVSLNITLPGATTGIGAKRDTSSILVFNDAPTSSMTHDARGTYKVYISDLSWASGIKTGTYLYQGQLSVEYIYAVGA